MTTQPKISLPEEYTQNIKSGMDAGGGIQLPFDCPYLWVTNGKPELKQLGGVSYYGGWQSNKVAVDDYIASTQNSMPAYFKPFQRETDSEVIEGYEMRHVFFAPIAWRQSWVTEKRRFGVYTEGGRHHVQILSYMLDHIIDDKKVHSYPGWGPIVLSAKGYQARNLRDSISAWEKYTAALRREIAPGVPSYFFALCVGTFGDKANFLEVGGKAKSKITPITPYLPEHLAAESLTNLFVGETTAAIMVDLKGQSADWLNAWKDEGIDSLPGGYDGDAINREPAKDEAPF